MTDTTPTPELFTILREYLGGSDVIDLNTPEGYAEFVDSVVQDQEVADELIERIRTETEVVINESDPLYIERYTVIPEGGL
jgi:hypothetical protein